MPEDDINERSFPLMKPEDILTPTAAILGLSVTSIALIVSISPQNPNIVRNFAAIMVGVVIVFVATAVTTSLATLLNRQLIWRIAIGLYVIGWIYLAGVLLILFIGYAIGIESFQLPQFNVLIGIGIPFAIALFFFVVFIWMLRYRRVLLKTLDLLFQTMFESMDAVTRRKVQQETTHVLAIERMDVPMSVVKTVIEIERTLKEIATSIEIEPKHKSISQLSRELFIMDVVDPGMVAAIDQVWRIRNYIVHGYGVSKSEARAALDLAATTLVALKDVQAELRARS